MSRAGCRGLRSHQWHSAATAVRQRAAWTKQKPITAQAMSIASASQPRRLTCAKDEEQARPPMLGALPQRRNVRAADDRSGLPTSAAPNCIATSIAPLALAVFYAQRAAIRPITVRAFKPQAAGSIPAGRIPQDTAIPRCSAASA